MCMSCRKSEGWSCGSSPAKVDAFRSIYVQCKIESEVENNVIYVYTHLSFGLVLSSVLAQSSYH